MSADVLIFPTGTLATWPEARLLRIAALEIDIQRFDAAAEDAAKLASECLDRHGKAQHEKVADYFRLHAAFSRHELQEAERWAIRSA